MAVFFIKHEKKSDLVNLIKSYIQTIKFKLMKSVHQFIMPMNKSTKNEAKSRSNGYLDDTFIKCEAKSSYGPLKRE